MAPKLPNAGSASSSVGRLNERSRALRKEITKTNPDKDLRPKLGDWRQEETGEGPKSYFSTLRNDWNRRQTAYEQRETQYKERIVQLEQQIEEVKAAGQALPTADPHMVDRAFLELHDMHETVVSNLERSEERTTKILREQERNLMRAFRARVHDTQKELVDVRIAKEEVRNARGRARRLVT